MFFQKAQKVTKNLGYFSKKNCWQELSKIVKFCHTESPTHLSLTQTFNFLLLFCLFPKCVQFCIWMELLFVKFYLPSLTPLIRHLGKPEWPEGLNKKLPNRFKKVPQKSTEAVSTKKLKSFDRISKIDKKFRQFGPNCRHHMFWKVAQTAMNRPFWF